MSNQLNELHGRIDRRFRQRARLGRHFMEQARRAADELRVNEPVMMTTDATGLPSPVHSHELSTPNYAVEYLERIFDAAKGRCLERLLEKRNDAVLVRVLATEIDWASIQGIARTE